MELHWHGGDAFREVDRALAEKRIRELARDHADLIDVRISARPTAHHRRGGQEVRITCEARGKEIVAARTRPDLGLALNETLDAFEREIWRMRHRRTQKRRERPASPREIGVVAGTPDREERNVAHEESSLRLDDTETRHGER